MAAQIELPGIPAPEPKELAITPMSLMQMALETGKADQLQILQEMYFKDLARKAEVEFNLAMNAVQTELGRIAPDLDNKQTSSKYASYAALDRAIRPVYTRHGFSLSFDSGDSAEGTVVAYCYVSHQAGHTRKYQSPAMPLPVMGPQGKAVMTATHGTGAAMSYAMRYLLKFIFNIAIGEDDTDGNGPAMTGADVDALQEWIISIEDSSSFEELQQKFAEAYRANTNQTARDAIIAAKDKRKRVLLAKSKGGAA